MEESLYIVGLIEGSNFKIHGGGGEGEERMGVGSRSEPIANKISERGLRVGRPPYDLK